jgi:uncharacterized membrane protein YcaP (DUF421 family)
MDWLSNMFVLAIPVIEKILRPIIIYLFLIIGLRLAGKRELAQLNPFDLVVLLTISNTVQNAIIGNDNSVSGGIIGATTLLIINNLVVRFVHRYRKLNQAVEGQTDYLIKDGVINYSILQREEISEEELLTAARKAGYHSLDFLEEATIDSNGSIDFFAKENVLAEARQTELLNRLDRLSKEMEVLRVEIARLNRDGGE